MTIRRMNSHEIRNGKESGSGVYRCRGLGKKSKVRRILSFTSFFLSSFAPLMLMPRQDVVVVVPPPLYPVLAG
jgi:hypothetical protein